jgi:virulence-associated protein VagC
VKKRLFKHGGSKAIDLPARFVNSIEGEHVEIFEDENGLHIQAVDPLDSLDHDPLFKKFLNSLAQESLAHPEKLKLIEEVWGEEWNCLIGKADEN